MCGVGDLVCYGQSALSGVAAKVTNSFLEEIRKSAADMTVSILKTLGTFWLQIPSPNVANADGTAAGPAGFLQGNLGYLTIVAAVFGLILCGGRLGITARSEHGAEAVKMLVRLIAVTAAGAGVVALLIKGGDEFSPWIIQTATGAPFDQSAPSLLTNEGLLAMTPLLTIIVAIFAVFGAGAMVIFMILRGALLIILIAVWPLATSLTGTEQGMQWYKKINAYLIAFVLLKPVASIIYSAGFLLLKDGHGFQTTDPGVSALMASLTGMAILAVAGLSLPALLRFVAPAAAAGSGAMTGAAVMGAAVAVGAAAVTMGSGAAASGAGAAAAAPRAASPSSEGATSTGGDGGGPPGSTEPAATGGGGGGGAGNAPSGSGENSSSGGGGASGSTEPAATGGGGGGGSVPSGSGENSSSGGGGASGSTEPAATGGGGGGGSVPSGSGGSSSSGGGGGAPEPTPAGAPAGGNGTGGGNGSVSGAAPLSGSTGTTAGPGGGSTAPGNGSGGGSPQGAAPTQGSGGGATPAGGGARPSRSARSAAATAREAWVASQQAGDVAAAAVEDNQGGPSGANHVEGT